MSQTAAAAVSPDRTPLLGRPSMQIALSIVASVCGTALTGAAGTSSTGQLIGAALGAAIPTLITVVGPGHEFRAGAGIAVTALALLVTYGGATARDYATGSPATFPLPAGVSQPDDGAQEPATNHGGTTSPRDPAQSVVQRDGEGHEISVTPTVLTCTSTKCPGPVRIRSTGKAAFSVTSIEVDGEFFHHDGTCANKELAPGEECQLGVSYTPTSGDEPRKATLVIHQTLTGGPTRVQLEGTGRSVTPTVDFAPPTVKSCRFTRGDSGLLQAELSASLTAADVSEGTPETVAVSAGIDSAHIDVKDALIDGEAVSLAVPIAQEAAVEGLVITVKADSRGEVPESHEDNNVARITAASVPTAGAACSA